MPVIDWLFRLLGEITNAIQPMLQQQEMSLALLSMVMAAGVVAGLTPFGLSTMVLVAGRTDSDGVSDRRVALQRALLFSLGAGVSLFAVGVVAAQAGQVLLDYRLARYLPVVTLVMGLQLLGLWRWRLLPRARMRSPDSSAFLLGLPFGVVAAPCTAPIIVAVLSLIAANGDVLFGLLVLLAFSIGRSAPLVVGCTYGRTAFRRLGGGRTRVLLTRALGAVILVASVYFLTLGRAYLGG